MQIRQPEEKKQKQRTSILCTENFIRSALLTEMKWNVEKNVFTSLSATESLYIN